MLEAGQKVGAAQVPGDARVLYSCGAPMKGVDLRIVHPDSARPCEDGHVGEIWLSSLCVTAGYYNRPQLNQEVFKVRAFHIRAYLPLHITQACSPMRPCVVQEALCMQQIIHLLAG